MLRIVTRSASKVLANLSRNAVRLAAQPRFSFSKSVEVSSKLKKAVQEQISHEESNIEDLSEFKNFFENQGWTINYEGIQVELSKKNGPYELRVLFNAKTPSLPEEGEQQQEEEMQEDNQDYTDVSVYIKKAGNDKWLYCEFMITGRSDAHLGLATFIKEYDVEKSEKAKGKIPAIGYAGPQISTLDEQFQESIYEFIEGVGITGELLQRAAEFSTAYEHQFYVEWLKDFKSLV